MISTQATSIGFYHRSAKRRQCGDCNFSPGEDEQGSYTRSLRPTKRARRFAPLKTYQEIHWAYNVSYQNHSNDGSTHGSSEDESDCDSMDIDLVNFTPPQEEPLEFPVSMQIDEPLVVVTLSTRSGLGYRASPALLYAPGRFKRRDTFGSVSRMTRLAEEEELN
jgi:hypothetical protein